MPTAQIYHPKIFPISSERKFVASANKHISHSAKESFLFKSTPGRYVCLIALMLFLLFSASTISVITILIKQQTYQSIFQHSLRLSSTSRDLATSLSEIDVALAEISVNPQLNQDPIAKLHSGISKSNQALMIIGEETGDRDPLMVQNLAIISGYLRIYATEAEKILQAPEKSTSDLILLNTTEISDNKLIPATEYIINYSINQLNKETNSVSTFPYPATVLTFVALISIILSSIFISRISGHIFNIGLLVATALVFMQMLWLVFAGLSSRYQGRQSRDLGVNNLTNLITMLNTAQRARRDELIPIVLTQFGGIYHSRYRVELNTLATMLSNTHPYGQDNAILLINAGQDLSHWSHLSDALYHTSPKSTANSSFLGRISIDPIKSINGSQYLSDVVKNDTDSHHFEENIKKIIENTQNNYTKHIQASYSNWEFAVSGIIVVTIISSLSLITAIVLRLKEYR